ncbi:hypothetical protein [Winogradskyella epiphytica]|nr:hypothetical protein [Winogradskyella epiphytica]
MKTTKFFKNRTMTTSLLSKTSRNVIGVIAMTAILFTNCESNDDATHEGFVETPPTAQEFENIRAIALDNHTQIFNFNADDGYITLTSEKGVDIQINANCLSHNGNPVSGDVTLEYVEIFEKGNMLTTNKPTMGRLPDGGKALLITGGEFYLEARQNGNILETTCGYQLVVPSDLTNGPDQGMTLWNGVIDDNGNLTWDEIVDDAAGGGLFMEDTSYYVLAEGFGWTNIDRFYSDPRPKTQLQVQPPIGYNDENSDVYLSYDGERPALAQLDTFDDSLNVFSEHYGQIPIGLECHLIFVTESNGQWRYAIKPVTIVANDIITFDIEETIVGTEESLIDLLNELP